MKRGNLEHRNLNVIDNAKHRARVLFAKVPKPIKSTASIVGRRGASMLPAVGLAATAAIEAYEYKSWSGENPEGGLDDYAAFRMDQLEQLAVSSKGKVELAARWAGETGGEIVDWSSETLEIGLVWSSTIVYGGANWTAQNAKSASSWAGETGLSAYSWATETMSQVGASWD